MNQTDEIVAQFMKDVVRLRAVTTTFIARYSDPSINNLLFSFIDTNEWKYLFHNVTATTSALLSSTILIESAFNISNFFKNTEGEGEKDDI